MLRKVRTKSWADFKHRLDAYATLSSKRRAQIIFRGQSNSAWDLTTTLDRRVQFEGQRERQDRIDHLLREFKRASVGTVEQTTGVDTDLEWQLLGRHHGLPTPIIDWTESPYIAAYFAMDDLLVSGAKYASVWAFDRDAFQSREVPEIEVVDSDNLVRFNQRAVEQRAVFLRVNDTSRPLETLLKGALVRYDVPLKDSSLALTDLDSMNVNARVLFRNLDGAARLADRRVLLYEVNS